MDGRLGVFIVAVTLVQIAERAGLSPATVSLALRNKNVGKKQFSSKTINKIHRIAKEMGYRPNGMATSLVSNKSNAICPLYFSAKFNIGGATPISVDVSSPNDTAPTLSYRLKVNGTATGYVSLAANERKTSNFTVASISAGTNVKLEIEADKGLVFHSMKLANAPPTDFNKDGIVNLLDFAILAENWYKSI
jgi:transcriptional regulator with XRE-family HTH domain